MSRTIGGLNELTPDDGILCDNCDEKVATWVGLTFRGTQLEPAEYVQICDDCKETT